MLDHLAQVVPVERLAEELGATEVSLATQGNPAV
jgi:hypothetical protein